MHIGNCFSDLSIAVLAVASKLIGSGLLAAATDARLVYTGNVTLLADTGNNL